MPEVIEGVEYFTAREAAEIKGVGKSTILKALAEGRLPVAKKIANTQFILGSDLTAYQPGSYGDKERTTIRRGPGRGKKAE